MFTRAVSRQVHYVQYPGNVFASHWVHVPIWNVFGAEKSFESTSAAFQATLHDFPEGPLHIADFCSVSCKNTMHIITKLVKELRKSSNREVVVAPTLLPIANWNEYFKLSLSPEYYGQFSNLFLSARPSTLWKQIHPTESIHFAYANHSFMPLSKMPVCEDTIWPTMSKDSKVVEELRVTATQDLDNLLTLRHKELKKKGRFIFDVLLDHDVPEESCWKLLNKVVSQFVTEGKITAEERSKIALRNYQRNEAIINEVLDKHKNNFRVVEKTLVKSRFPAWDDYQTHKDAKKLAQTYSDWLKEWTAPAILMNLGQSRSQEEKTGLISSIYERLTNETAKHPIPVDVELYDFVLEKIN